MNAKKRHINKKRHLVNRRQSASVKGEKSYYKCFVCCCIVLLVGIFLPEYYGLHYLEFSFLYLIVLPISFVVGIYLRFMRKLKNGLLYISLWATFCSTFSLYTIVNLIYTYNGKDSYSFESRIEGANSSGYRSPASLYFKLDGKGVSLVVRNELPVKERLERGEIVKISGHYKKGLLSSVMIEDYAI